MTPLDVVLATVYRQHKQFRHRDALRLIERALPIYPDVPQLYVARGVTRMHFHNPAGALADFERAQALGDSSMELEVHLGEAELLSGAMERGVQRLLGVLKASEKPGKPVAEQPHIHRRAGFVLATFQKVASAHRGAANVG
jgi:hypothetical protein